MPISAPSAEAHPYQASQLVSTLLTHWGASPMHTSNSTSRSLTTSPFTTSLPHLDFFRIGVLNLCLLPDANILSLLWMRILSAQAAQNFTLLLTARRSLLFFSKSRPSPEQPACFQAEWAALLWTHKQLSVLSLHFLGLLGCTRGSCRSAASTNILTTRSISSSNCSTSSYTLFNSGASPACTSASNTSNKPLLRAWAQSTLSCLLTLQDWSTGHPSYIKQAVIGR